MSYRANSDGLKYMVRAAGGESIQHRIRIIRATGEVETHVIQISADNPAGVHVIAELNRGDRVEVIP